MKPIEVRPDLARLINCLSIVMIVVCLDFGSKHIVTRYIDTNPYWNFSQDMPAIDYVQHHAEDFHFPLYVVQGGLIFGIIMMGHTTFIPNLPYISYGAAFLCGGGTGNIAELTVKGYATDFIKFGMFDVVLSANVADMFCLIGITSILTNAVFHIYVEMKQNKMIARCNK
jgi:lipoprotein signal peptidase